MKDSNCEINKKQGLMANDIRGLLAPVFPTFIVLQLRKNPGKNPTRKIDPTGDQTRVR